jgi:hypothetical protein
LPDWKWSRTVNKGVIAVFVIGLASAGAYWVYATQPSVHSWVDLKLADATGAPPPGVVAGLDPCDLLTADEIGDELGRPVSGFEPSPTDLIKGPVEYSAMCRSYRVDFRQDAQDPNRSYAMLWWTSSATANDAKQAFAALVDEEKRLVADEAALAAMVAARKKSEADAEQAAADAAPMDAVPTNEAATTPAPEPEHYLPGAYSAAHHRESVVPPLNIGDESVLLGDSGGYSAIVRDGRMVIEIRTAARDQRLARDAAAALAEKAYGRLHAMVH